MKQFYLLLLFLYPLAHLSLGQNHNQAVNVTDLVSSNYYFVNLPVKSPGKVKSLYLNEKWESGNFKLKDTVLKDYPVRYDWINKVLEIRHGRSVKLCYNNLLNYLEYTSGPYKSRLFVNTRNFSEVPPRLRNEMAEVICSGKMSLLKSFEVDFLMPTYNPALDIGEKEEKPVLKTEYYVAKGNKMEEMVFGRKKFYQLFGHNADEVKQFVKKHKLHLKKEEDLARIFDYYNQLE
ncbi:MAG: hypothetical protein ACNS62_19240 [Candidatus Cyclobacteriaceae bacterium M3_2C_046]